MTLLVPSPRVAKLQHATDDAVAAVLSVLPCRTPTAWLEHALCHVDVLLIDHANCEKKAAGAALNLMYRYVDKPPLLTRMARLAREELRHFEQVLQQMAKHGVTYRHLTPGRYAAALRAHVRHAEPGRLVDLLLIGAIVEARSCERFELLARSLDAPLAGFYRRLLASEAGHFAHYLALARRYAGAGDQNTVSDRLQLLLAHEARLIAEPDDVFRFHSGVPVT
jgi:tRNA 2-(methylsulfanyl)-N6-isopentenyladenosine37 hydroxylase